MIFNKVKVKNRSSVFPSGNSFLFHISLESTFMFFFQFRLSVATAKQCNIASKHPFMEEEKDHSDV